ncbi:MAG TPA: zinc-binding dehydrogenase, partial [Kofleriaceae bacterium]|nr:zinc-binding dehydrogenase [Kofleriaceae bacterium]
MARKGFAVIARELNKPVVVEEVTFDAPARGEVLVKIEAAGVCHSDLSGTNGTIAMPLPLILGHEAAGSVIEVGEGVTEVAVGDRVLANWIYMCGRCHYCNIGRPVLCDQQGKALSTMLDGTTRTRDAAGRPLNVFSGVGVMAEYAVVHERSLVKYDPSVPADRAALVGCAVTTGVGAAINTARVQPGSSCGVWGVGGVGLNVIQGCAIAGASRIVAIDTSDSKLELARRFGATDLVKATPGEDLTKPLKKLTGGGLDYAFECVGSGEVAAAAYKATRRGGMAVVVGVAPASASTTIVTRTLPFEEKTLTGSYFGSARPREDFPKMLAFYTGGKLKLD